MARKNSKMGGFTVTEICIVVVLVALIALVAAVAGPNFVNRRSRSSPNTCINNLRVLDGAKAEWAYEHHKQLTDIPTRNDIQPYIGRGPSGALPFCPDDPKQTFDTSYSINNMVTKPTCKILPTTHILP